MCVCVCVCVNREVFGSKINLIRQEQRLKRNMRETEEYNYILQIMCVCKYVCFGPEDKQVGLNNSPF